MKIGIVQDKVIRGGRIVVIIEMVRVLNEFGIVPDILTFEMAISKEDINSKYGKQIRYNVRQVRYPFLPNKFVDFNKVWFNYRLRKYVLGYDCLIEHNNTSVLLPDTIKVLSYIHFPRVARVNHFKSIHKKEEEHVSIKTKIVRKLDKTISKYIYKRNKLPQQNAFLANSEYTKNKFLKYYGYHADNIAVLHPPIDTTKFQLGIQKENWVCSIGRFTPEKGQLQQIKIAEKTPDLIYKIMGFAEKNSPYFKECQRYINQKQLKNVNLLPGIAYGDMVDILQRSTFFLHTFWNEPFGITTVEGIAAGCIPVVPDSGGQREIVPFETLRFEDIDGAVTILQKPVSFYKQHLAKLQEHIQQYDTTTFNRKFKAIFKLYLDDIH